MEVAMGEFIDQSQAKKLGYEPPPPPKPAEQK